jgi:hypothetical protein
MRIEWIVVDTIGKIYPFRSIIHLVNLHTDRISANLSQLPGDLIVPVDWGVGIVSLGVLLDFRTCLGGFLYGR